MFLGGVCLLGLGAYLSWKEYRNPSCRLDGNCTWTVYTGLLMAGVVGIVLPLWLGISDWRYERELAREAAAGGGGDTGETACQTASDTPEQAGAGARGAETAPPSQPTAQPPAEDSDRERTAILARLAVQAMAAVAAADGQFHEGEISVIRYATRDKLGAAVDEQALFSIYGQVSADRSLAERGLGENRQNMTDEERRTILLCAGLTALADGDFADSEKTVFTRLAAALGLSLDEQEAIRQEAVREVEGYGFRTS